MQSQDTNPEIENFEKTPSADELDPVQAEKAAEWDAAMESVRTPDADWSSLESTEEHFTTSDEDDTAAEDVIDAQAAGGNFNLDNISTTLKQNYIAGAAEQSYRNNLADINDSLTGTHDAYGESVENNPLLNPDGGRNFAQETYEAVKGGVTAVEAAESLAIDAISSNTLDLRANEIRTRLDQAEKLAQIAIYNASKTNNSNATKIGNIAAEQIKQKVEKIRSSLEEVQSNQLESEQLQNELQASEAIKVPDALAAADEQPAEPPAYSEILGQAPTEATQDTAPTTIEEAVISAQENIIAAAAADQHPDEAALRQATGE